MIYHRGPRIDPLTPWGQPWPSLAAASLVLEVVPPAFPRPSESSGSFPYDSWPRLGVRRRREREAPARPGQQMFTVKGQVVNILGFVGLTISISTTQTLC